MTGEETLKGLCTLRIPARGNDSPWTPLYKKSLSHGGTEILIIQPPAPLRDRWFFCRVQGAARPLAGVQGDSVPLRQPQRPLASFPTSPQLLRAEHHGNCIHMLISILGIFLRIEIVFRAERPYFRLGGCDLHRQRNFLFIFNGGLIRY